MPQLSPNTNSFALRSSLFALLFSIVACHSQQDCNTALDQAMARLQKRDDWTERPVQQLPRHPAEKFLRGWVIVLDPGHGGAAHRRGYKRGPSGVREAEINLRVALLVERLLADAGAKVILTRRSDVDLSLEKRSEVANTARRPDGGPGADLFLSLHHNLDRSPDVNYTSIWYHAEVDFSEPSLDVARYLAHAIGRALRTNVGYDSPLMSDRQMYQGGFGVLRNLKVPGVLLESSFYSNRAEEQRLRDAGYNLREAYAIYEALCEYAYGGRPTQSVPVVVGSNSLTLSTFLDDGLPRDWWTAGRNRIVTSSIAVELDGQTLEFDYQPSTRRLQVGLPLSAAILANSAHVVSIHHQNLFKHHNWPQRYKLRATCPLRTDGRWQLSAEPIGQIRADRVPD